MSINHVVISGNLTRDPDERRSASGMAILKLGVAVNDRQKKGDEWVDYPNFLDVTVFGKRAESLASKLAKGSKVYVVGKLRWSQWDSNGEKRSKVEIIADTVEYERRDRDEQPAQTSLYAEDLPF